MININSDAFTNVVINIDKKSQAEQYTFKFVNSVTKKIVSLELIDNSPFKNRYNQFSIAADLINVGDGELFINDAYFDLYKSSLTIQTTKEIFFQYLDQEDIIYDY